MKNAVAINGSPLMERGETALVLDSFIQGMHDAGSEIEQFYASRLDIKPCSCGTMYCWSEDPGQCCIKDDMQGLLARLKAAETLVLATPVYIPLPGAMQNLINRLCPLIDPYLENREGRTRARFREDVHIRTIVLVSTSGWWEAENMGTVVHIADELARNAGVEFAGAVLRPHAFMMRKKGVLTEDGKAVLDAVRRAGCELASKGVMNEGTLEAVRRPLIAEDELRQRYNQGR